MMEQMMPPQEAPKGSPASFAGMLANYLEAQIKTTQQFIKELRNAEKQARKFEQEESKAAAGTRKRKKASDPSKPKCVAVDLKLGVWCWHCMFQCDDAGVRLTGQCGVCWALCGLHLLLHSRVWWRAAGFGTLRVPTANF